VVVLAVAGGAVYAATSLFKNQDQMVAKDVNENDSTLPTITIPDEKEPPTVPLDKRIPKVAAKFVKTAVTRDNVAASWKLTGECLKGLPCLKAGFTRKMWLTGNIPVVPYPAYGGVKYAITYSHPDDALLEVEVFPRKGSSIKPAVFHIELHKYPGKGGNPWKVIHWAPRSMSLVQSNGD
jgi:hypothetical protein